MSAKTMQRAELAGLNDYLGKLEKNLARLRALREKGCLVDSSLYDIFSDLTNVGARLEKARAEGNGASKLGEIRERHKRLLAELEYIRNEVKSQDEGVIFASKTILPGFFYRITSHYRGFWKFYEAVVTLFGVGIIGYTLITLTYFFAFGDIPLIQFPAGGISPKNSLGFLSGVILGACVHEFAHGVVLANNGIKIMQVGALAGSLVGGFVEADEVTFGQTEPRVHLRFNASSIGTNALAAVVLSLIGLLTSSDLVLFMALGDLFFGVTNSFPVRPLDGGWVYEDLINMYLPNKKIRWILSNARFVMVIVWLLLLIRPLFV